MGVRATVLNSKTICMRRNGKMVVGLVLSGGGARGDFEVGAVRYLYELGIRSTVLTGSPVGLRTTLS